MRRIVHVGNIKGIPHVVVVVVAVVVELSSMVALIIIVNMRAVIQRCWNAVPIVVVAVGIEENAVGRSIGRDLVGTTHGMPPIVGRFLRW